MNTVKMFKKTRALILAREHRSKRSILQFISEREFCACLVNGQILLGICHNIMTKRKFHKLDDGVF